MNPLVSRAPLGVALALALSGCASMAPRAGDQDVNALLADRHGPQMARPGPGSAAQEAQAIKEWLDQPMTADSAVRVAMLRSPRLQQEYARLGLAHAEVLEAVQLANPRLSLSRAYLSPGDGYQRTAGLSLPLVDLLVLPVRARLAHAEFGRAKLEIASAVLGVAADVEAAWYGYVGARQVADLRAAVSEGAEASAELARRFHAAGNISELQLNLELAAASGARIDAARARAEAARARLALNTLVGLSGEEADWKASDRLLLPVEREDDPAELAALARDSSLELLSARRQADILADALGITRRLRWLGGTEIGYERETDPDGSRLQGPSLSLELPIFNQGQARVARSEALLAKARARVAQAELGVDNAIRLGSQQVRELAAVVAIHREALIPQREKVVERSQQEQNYMLIGVFELIQAKLKEYDAYEGYLVAVRDYWLARVELMRAVGQRLPSDASARARTPSVRDILAPADGAAMDHSGHDMSSMPGAGSKTTAEPAMDHSGHDMSSMKHDAPEPAAAPEPAHDHSRPAAPVDAAEGTGEDAETHHHDGHGGQP